MRAHYARISHRIPPAGLPHTRRNAPPLRRCANHWNAIHSTHAAASAAQDLDKPVTTSGQAGGQAPGQHKEKDSGKRKAAMTKALNENRRTQTSACGAPEILERRFHSRPTRRALERSRDLPEVQHSRPRPVGLGASALGPNLHVLGRRGGGCCFRVSHGSREPPACKQRRWRQPDLEMHFENRH